MVVTLAAFFARHAPYLTGAEVVVVLVVLLPLPLLLTLLLVLLWVVVAFPEGSASVWVGTCCVASVLVPAEAGLMTSWWR
jgi:integral membrane sensor domain MASE1